jgi:3-isopropylmalate/(R)-2-methylmalate dehydratase small subunit
MLRGRALKLGDHVSTDAIIPSRLADLRANLPELAKHIFEDLDPDFLKKIKPGDFLVAGRNFGLGSSREYAPLVIKMSGISLVLVKSVARIFFRNAINIGLPVLRCDTDRIKTGDDLEVDLELGRVRNLTTGVELISTRIPPFMAKVLEEGGLLSYINKYGDFQIKGE